MQFKLRARKRQKPASTLRKWADRASIGRFLLVATAALGKLFTFLFNFRAEP